MEFFWSVFSRIWTEYGPENLQIARLFTQYQYLKKWIRQPISDQCFHFILPWNIKAPTLGVLKKFANFTGKHQWWSFCLITLQAWGHATLLKRDSKTGVFLWNLRNLQEHLFLQNISSGCVLKHYKNKVLLVFSGGIKWKHWQEMDK